MQDSNATGPSQDGSVLPTPNPKPERNKKANKGERPRDRRQTESLTHLGSSVGLNEALYIFDFWSQNVPSAHQPFMKEIYFP